MNDWDEIIMPIIATVIIIISIIFILGSSIYFYTVHIGEANIIRVFVNGQVVYQGKKAFVDINSGGMTTTVILYRQLFPFKIIGRLYSDADVKIDNGRP